MEDVRRHAAELLRKFVDNESDPYDFDDFISCPTKDPLVERVRKEVHLIPEQYPPLHEFQYTSEEGAARILELANELEFGLKEGE